MALGLVVVEVWNVRIVCGDNPHCGVFICDYIELVYSTAIEPNFSLEGIRDEIGNWHESRQRVIDGSWYCFKCCG